MFTTNRKAGSRRILSLALWVFTAVLLWAASASAAPYVYVLNRGSEDLSVVDLHTSTEIAVLDVRQPGLEPAVAAEPREMILHPNGREIYVLANTYVAVVDVETLDPARTLFVSLSGDDARGFALDASGRTLFVSFKNSSTLTQIDTASLSVTDRTLPSSDLRHLDLSGTLLFGVNNAGDIFRLDTASGVGSVIGSGIFRDPEDLTIAANGQEVVVSSEANMGVYSFDANIASIGPSSSQTLAGGYHPGRVRVLASGELAVVDLSNDAVDFIDGSYLSLPFGSAPTDVDENESGTSVVTLRNGASLGFPAGTGVLRVESGPNPVYVAVGANPTAIEMSRGGVGELSISPDPVRFRYSNIGDVVRRNATIRNTGDESVAITRIGIAAGPFRVVQDSCPGSLAPAGSCTVTVEFVAPAWTKGCSAVLSQVLCVLQVPSYRSFLDVENDAASNPVAGVALWAGRFTTEELRKVESTPVELIKPWGDIFVK